MSLFIFEPGEWLGEGEITFTITNEKTLYFTKWVVYPAHKNSIKAEHSVQIDHVIEPVVNEYTFTQVSENEYKVQLNHSIAGIVEGVATLNTDTLRWEFKGHPEVQGFESYTVQEDGTYKVEAKYTSEEDHSSLIHGKLWKKA